MTATVLGGTRLRELDAALQPHNLATPVGTNPDTGVTGLMLGGGVGYLSRRFGMTIDQVVSVKVNM